MLPASEEHLLLALFEFNSNSVRSEVPGQPGQPGQPWESRPAAGGTTPGWYLPPVRGWV